MTLKELQDDFLVFRQHCMWLRNCYNMFQALYTSQPTIDVLRKNALTFFGDLNIILQEYFFLQVRKITDPAISLGRQNLSITHINTCLELHGLMNSEIAGLTSRISNYRAITKDIVNRVVAHSDRVTVYTETLVGEHTEEELHEFINAIQGYTDAVGNALGLGPLDYKVQSCPGDARDLIRALQGS